MLNINEKIDNNEEVETKDNFSEDVKNQYEYYDSNYNVNFFGAGRSTEEW
jgi:hypothetical protein